MVRYREAVIVNFEPPITGEDRVRTPSQPRNEHERRRAVEQPGQCRRCCQREICHHDRDRLGGRRVEAGVDRRAQRSVVDLDRRGRLSR
jgi:hypothetical protein